MRSWRRLRAGELRCGHCRARIRAGDAYFERRGPGWEQIRCVTCAGEPVPADLPESENVNVVTHDPLPKRAPLFTGVAELAADWKTRQGGDR